MIDTVVPRRTPRRIVVHAAIAHVHAFDDGKPYRCAALDDPPPAHIASKLDDPGHTAGSARLGSQLANCVLPVLQTSPYWRP